MNSFVIFSLPRCRTAWLSHFLSYGDWICGHEELRYMRTLDDIRIWFTQPNIGTIETAAAPFWRLLPKNVKVVVIRRPVQEVVKSLLSACPGCFNEDELIKNITKLDKKLCQISKRVPGVLSLSFDSLNDENICAKLFEHCLEIPHNHEYWANISKYNIQINLKSLVRYSWAYRESLAKLANSAKQQILNEMHLKHQVVESDGVIFQEESFENWVKDGQKLFENHCVLVGESPNEWAKKNIPLMEKLYNAGALQVVTARSNGRMFGYLVSVISPSLVSKNIKSGIHTTFYVDPSLPGAGIKLQRTANSILKTKQVDEILMQAGVRGSGERISSLYKRLGAKNIGQLYQLDLKEAI